MAEHGLHAAFRREEFIFPHEFSYWRNTRQTKKNQSDLHLCLIMCSSRGFCDKRAKRSVENQFFDAPFDDVTQLKLALFRGYIREWLPVFLTNRHPEFRPTLVNIFDFFAGPGEDTVGTAGSPMIIIEELSSFCSMRGELKAPGTRLAIHLNDLKEEHVEHLRRKSQSDARESDWCSVEFSCYPFRECLARFVPLMQEPSTANLVIMDQYGLKQVTPQILGQLAGCSHTDILFFISSSFVRRFARSRPVAEHLGNDAARIAQSEYKWVHRGVCNYYGSKLPAGQEYHLVPFSLKKGANIYGVIFGTRSLLGLWKFLKVCWALDPTTGEANYDIDDDPVRAGGLSLFPEYNVTKKEDAFHRELEDEILRQNGTADNLQLFRFTLKRGFLPSHASNHLKVLQKAGRLHVEAIGHPVPKTGAFYLTWPEFKKSIPRVRFRMETS